MSAQIARGIISKGQPQKQTQNNGYLRVRTLVVTVCPRERARVYVSESGRRPSREGWWMVGGMRHVACGGGGGGGVRDGEC